MTPIVYALLYDPSVNDEFDIAERFSISVEQAVEVLENEVFYMILQGLNKLKSMPAYSDLINDLMNQSLDISSKRGQKAFVVLTKLIEMQSKFRQFQPLDNSQTIE